MSVLFVNNERVTALPEDWHALSAHGTRSFEWRLLDRQLRQVGVLTSAPRNSHGQVVQGASGVLSGNLTFNVDAETRGAGSVRWTGRFDAQPDWVNLQIQPWYRLTTPDGSLISWPLGVFVPATPKVDHGEGDWVTVDVQMFDRTLLLRQRSFPWAWATRGPGSLVSFARDVIASAQVPQLPSMIEDDDTPPRTPLVFDRGTSRMEVLNAILDAAGYFAAYADGEGVIRSERYRPPAERSVVWDFEDTEARASYSPGFEVERDWFAIPNRVIAISQGSGEQPSMVAQAENWDAADPLSITNRGQVDEVLEGVEAASQAILNQHAARTLAERRARGRTVALNHVPLPLTVNDRVNFRRDAHGVSLPGVVRTISAELSPTALWSSTVREVVA